VTFVVSLFLAMVLILLVVTSYYRKVRLSQVEAVAESALKQIMVPLPQRFSETGPEDLWQNRLLDTGPLYGLSIDNIYLLKSDSTLAGRKNNTSRALSDRIRAEMILSTVNKRPARLRLGNQWVFPGSIARFLLVCCPMNAASAYKAAGLLVDLAPIKAEIVKLNNLMLTYFMVNLVVFAFIGAYRLNHIYLRPIQRMVKRAEDFREEDAFLFAARSGDDEINHLSKSLNLLLNRISEDKRQLQRTVSQLEVANRNLKQAQNEIVRAETLASVGRLASGVAHEIGNPIGIVLGYLDLLSSPEIEPENRKDYLQRIEVEVQRINGIIRQLLDLSRPADSHTDLIQLHAVLVDTVAIVRPQPMMKYITIETHLAAEHDSVLASPEQLRQVFLNLLLNAADAINTAGKATGRIRIQSRLISDGQLESGKEMEFVELLFEDDGPGIPAELEGHIFEPFFTTKEPGKGTGLGLSVSFMIIENLKGQLSAEAIPEGGMRMCIKLPLYAGEAAASVVRKEPT
jgi:signal transduction histidine kinase